jgi:hypothetical protein
VSAESESRISGMPQMQTRNSTRDLPLVWTLRLFGCIDMLALTAVLMPKAWIASASQWSGLGEFPDMAVAGYLARSSSALYALHGIMVVYMSFDVRRYWPLIRFLASLALLHGLVMFGIDLAEGMPTWWLVFEGPAFAASGALVLAAQFYGGATETPAC